MKMLGFKKKFWPGQQFLQIRRLKERFQMFWHYKTKITERGRWQMAEWKLPLRLLATKITLRWNKPREAARYNPHALKLKYDPLGYEEELEADSTNFLFNNQDKLSAAQKENIKKGDELGDAALWLVKTTSGEKQKCSPLIRQSRLSSVGRGWGFYLVTWSELFV